MYQSQGFIRPAPSSLTPCQGRHSLHVCRRVRDGWPLLASCSETGQGQRTEAELYCNPDLHLRQWHLSKLGITNVDCLLEARLLMQD